MRLLLLVLFLPIILLLQCIQPSFFLHDGNGNNLSWEENEGDHYPCKREWWNVDAFFVANKKNWSVTASFEYEMETPACNLFLTLFDHDNGTYYDLGSYGDKMGALIHEKGDVNLSYNNSWMKGKYPDYFVHFERKGIIINMHYHAISPPKFVADNISNGILPMGAGYYVYGFIPYCIVEGNISMNGRIFSINGKGYYEHVWGNWTYGSPFGKTDSKKVLSAYYRLGKWWLSHHKISIPSSLTLATDNNMFGYDWAWATFSNNWSLFYGNVLFWITKGPAFGILYLAMPNGKYITFSNIHHEYGKMVYVEKYDVYYPSEIFIKAKEGTKKLYLHFIMTSKVHAYIDTNISSKYWRAIALWESPGIVKGYYSNGSTNISLNGKCEIEPDRQISILGHGELNMNFFTLPHGIGFDMEMVSHLLGIQFEMEIHLFPPKTRFYFCILRGA